MEFTWEDARRLSSTVHRNQVLLDKKRRWLMRLPTEKTPEGTRKSQRAPKFLSTRRYLPESYLRNDEVPLEILRTRVEKAFGSPGDSQESHHIVHDYLHLFDKERLESENSDFSDFIKAFSSIINDLNNNGLCHIAHILTDGGKITFKKRSSYIRKAIKSDIKQVFKKSDQNGNLRLLEKLSEIFKSPYNFRKKQLAMTTPISARLCAAIDKALERLDEMPFQTLSTMNRKLRGTEASPQFPPALSTCSRDKLLEIISNKCKMLIPTLKEGMDLPKPLAKALSVMILSTKLQTGNINLSTSEFFPFASEVLNMQNEILRALWSLKKIEYRKLKVLQSVVDPQGKVANKKFRIALRKYLMEYLFECDEIAVPEDVLYILAFINRKQQLLMHLNEMCDEEADLVLNVSAHLNQVVSSLLPDSKISEANGNPFSEAASSDDDSDNDFQLEANEQCSYPGNSKRQQLGKCSLTKGETTGDWTPSPSIGSTVTTQFVETNRNDMSDCAFKKQVDGNNSSHPGAEVPAHIPQFHTPSIRDICDEASFYSNRIIGHLLNKFI